MGADLSHCVDDSGKLNEASRGWQGSRVSWALQRALQRKTPAPRRESCRGGLGKGGPLFLALKDRIERTYAGSSGLQGDRF